MEKAPFFSSLLIVLPKWGMKKKKSEISQLSNRLSAMNIGNYLAVNILSLIGELFFCFKSPDKAVVMYEKAHKILPTDYDIIIRLAEFYEFAQQYLNAKKLLEGTEVVNTKDIRINRVYINVLYHTGTPIEDVIPYIRAYFKNRPEYIAEHVEVPFMYKVLVRVFRPKSEYIQTIEGLKNANFLGHWEQWAIKLVEDYKQTQEVKADDHFGTLSNE